jgi:hypothetical protein
MTEGKVSTDLHDVVPVLRDMCDIGLIGRFAIGGAFAAIIHHEPISTIDLDIFFLFRTISTGPILSLSPIYDYARGRGFSFDHEFVNIHGWLVQFVEASHNPLWVEAVEQAETIMINGEPIPVIGREHLVAMWLFAGRTKDYHKIAMFSDAGILDIAKLLAILERHELMVKWEKEKWRFESDEAEPNSID